MKQFSSEIIETHSVAEGFHEMRFSWDGGASKPLPGQFFTIRVADTTAPLLRRPFAFSGFDDGSASFIYQKRGLSTEILAGKEAGDSIDIIAPIGNCFTIPQPGKTAIILAGGIGLGPMIFLADAINKTGGEARLVFGCRDASLVPRIDAFSRLGPIICTDNGSAGFHGTVVDYLSTLPADLFERAAFFACGPNPMLKAAHSFAQSKAVDCLVSMEQTMACGVGACMGCVVEINSEPGFARVCKDGPIFDSREIKWN